MKRNLEQTLQDLYDSGIPVTITMLWDGGIDYALIAYKDIGTEKEEWEHLQTFAELADGLHNLAVKQFPQYREKPTAVPELRKRDLAETLQAIYDGELNFTITWARPTGVDFAMRSYMTYHDMAPEDWRHTKNYWTLAEAIRRVAVESYPVSDYAKRFG